MLLMLPLVPLLDEALLKLREPDRLAVILHFMEGRTFQEVGSALGIGEDTAEPFFNPTLRASMPDPSHLLDMDKAAERLASSSRYGPISSPPGKSARVRDIQPEPCVCDSVICTCAADKPVARPTASRSRCISSPSRTQ